MAEVAADTSNMRPIAVDGLMMELGKQQPEYLIAGNFVVILVNGQEKKMFKHWLTGKGRAAGSSPAEAVLATRNDVLLDVEVKPVNGSRVGIECSHASRATIAKIDPTGAIATYNSMHQDSPIKLGDTFVKVNNVQVNSKQDMREALGTEGVWTATLLRHGELQGGCEFTINEKLARLFDVMVIWLALGDDCLSLPNLGVYRFSRDLYGLATHFGLRRLQNGIRQAIPGFCLPGDDIISVDNEGIVFEYFRGCGHILDKQTQETIWFQDGSVVQCGNVTSTSEESTKFALSVKCRYDLKISQKGMRPGSKKAVNIRPLNQKCFQKIPEDIMQ